MFTFFHRTPEINVDGFTFSPSVYEYAPLVRAVDTVPEFWKSLANPDPKHYVDEQDGYRVIRQSTLKNCYGFIELYKRGFILENWSAIAFLVEQEGYRFYYADLDQPQSHPKEQLGSGFTDFHHAKLISPWLIKEKTGVKFHFGPAAWSHDKYDFVMPPGILDYRMNHATHVNLLLRAKPEPYNITIEFGEPLAHIIPLTDKKIKLTNHLVDQFEYDKLKIHTANSFMGWRKVVKLMDRNEQRGKCPMGFGN